MIIYTWNRINYPVNSHSKMNNAQGIYLIAAGASSKNRKKTLDKSWSISEIQNYVPGEIIEKLNYHFPEGNNIYAWGANQRSYNELSQVKPNEFVVDVKNKDIVQLFKFCFWFKTQNTDLQEFFGWDNEKPVSKRRPYRYVYFLSNPINTSIKRKEYFQNAFDLTDNSQWLVGQKYFSENEVSKALERTKSSSISEFLKIKGNDIIHESPRIFEKNTQKNEKEPVLPEWLKAIIIQIKKLQSDSNHLERDHEDIVANFFEKLGYNRISEIKFQKGENRY